MLLKKYWPFFIALPVFAFPAIFLYTQNIAEMNFADIGLPLLLSIAAGYVLFLLALLISKDAKCAALFSSLAGLVLLNYSFIDKLSKRILPLARRWHIVILLLVAFGVCVYVLSRKMPTLTQALGLLIAICFTALTLLNIAYALPAGISKLAHVDYESDAQAAIIESKSDRPNIYYLVYDEYASFYQLETYLGYKNTELADFFDKNAITASQTSYNDANDTKIILTNLFMLDYVAKYGSSADEMDKMRLKAPLHDVLARAGYTERGAGGYEWLGINGEINSGAGATTDMGKSIWELFLENTCFSQGGSFNLHNDDSKEGIESDFDELDNLEIRPDSSLFTMYYVMCPHPPYFFRANGEINADAYDTASEAPKIPQYVEQLKYTTARMKTALERIIEQDPGAIIVISSDHGFRFDDNTPYFERRRVLNAVYYKGQELKELEGKSAVNTMRLLLNKELGLSLEYKEVPRERG